MTDDTKVIAASATVELDDASTVAELNAIAPKAGVITGSIAATSLASLSDLSTAGTDVITITVNDANSTNLNAEDLSAIGGKTGGTVTVSNAVNIQGTTDQVTAALVTADTKVTASTALVSLDDNPTISQLNDIAGKTAGAVTATLDANSLSNLGALTTAGTDVITCLLYTSPSPRDNRVSRMPSSA